MGAETPNQVATAAQAVFLSYASQDANAARRICDALRSEGIEVWFDQSELRGGDAWDHSIRKQIKSCALFIPVVSRHTHDREEGYFRLEWKLAVDRSHLMTAHRAFLLPVVIDDTRDDDENVPDRFREVQWTRLPDGQTPPAFVERVKRLLAPQSPASQPASTAAPTAPAMRESLRAPWRSKTAIGATVAVLAAASIYLLVARPWVSKHPAAQVTATAAAPAAPVNAVSFAPPPHSIAVLPFVNMSGDKEQEYFSDGLTEELLNSLAEINELQVAARTSAFSFKGTNTDIGTIARKLNVGTVLEGSVRRSGNTVRITTQLINAVTGFHLWSHTYDRNLGDVLKLQTEIADAVAGALKVNLLGEAATKIELGGTHNPAAFDAYLRGSRAFIARYNADDFRTAISAYTEAIRLDPNYARAYAARSMAHRWQATGANAPETVADALKAISLAPELGEAHLALANAYAAQLHFSGANEEYERALALAPGNAQVLESYGNFAVAMGHTDLGLAAARRAVLLDPLNRSSHYALGATLRFARQYEEAIESTRNALTIDPELPFDIAAGYMWVAYYELGDLQGARAACNNKRDNWLSQVCLAVIYDKLGQHGDAEAQLAKLRADDSFAYQWAQIYAQWSNVAKGLDALDVALRLRDPGLRYLKVDSLLNPLRREPRFQAIERELKFPN